MLPSIINNIKLILLVSADRRPLLDILVGSYRDPPYIGIANPRFWSLNISIICPSAVGQVILVFSGHPRRQLSLSYRCCHTFIEFCSICAIDRYL